MISSVWEKGSSFVLTLFTLPCPVASRQATKQIVPRSEQSRPLSTTNSRREGGGEGKAGSSPSSRFRLSVACRLGCKQDVTPRAAKSCLLDHFNYHFFWKPEKEGSVEGSSVDGVGHLQKREKVQQTFLHEYMERVSVRKKFVKSTEEIPPYFPTSRKIILYILFYLLGRWRRREAGEVVDLGAVAGEEDARHFQFHISRFERL